MSDSTEETSSKNPGGKPLTIDDARLLSNRDCWIGLLSNRWADIGWTLNNVRTPDDVRRVFASIGNAAGDERALLAPFVRETTTPTATANDIQQSRKRLKALNEDSYALVYDGSISRQQNLSEGVRESKFALRDAWKATDPHSPALRDEHVRRVEKLATFRRERDWLEQQRSANEHMLANQEAGYARRELCTFIRRTAYAFTPRTIARAMAGLPDIGASQSYRRCSQHPEDAHAWPTSRYRIFRIIEQAWRDRSDRLKATFLARLQKRARAIRGTDDDGMTDHASGVARQFFFKNWWYLEQAINAIDIGGIDRDEVPFAIASDFHRRVAGSSPAARVLASASELKESPPTDAKKRRRRRKNA